MGQVIQMKDYKHEWQEIIELSDGYTVMHVYMDKQNGELDITLINDDGECVRIALPTVESIALGKLIQDAHHKMMGKKTDD